MFCNDGDDVSFFGLLINDVYKVADMFYSIEHRQNEANTRS